MNKNKNKNKDRNKIAGEKERPAECTKIERRQWIKYQKNRIKIYNNTEYTKYNRQQRLVVIHFHIYEISSKYVPGIWY